MIFDNYIKNNRIQADDDLLNIHEALDLISKDAGDLLAEEALITPYYIDGRKKYELYQYEFCLSGESFQEFLERKTGKKAELVDKDIIILRAMCFANLHDGMEVVSKNIKNYFEYLLSNPEIQEEISEIFGSYDEEKMFMEIY
ncbi:hypothetical protein [Butyrivibrio sp. AE3009]|uniref:hypothetical protein n=1 Tax=Butyrivibrio sp. AE3009 TaxID=1280666 RepID=UPI0003B3FB59|nr:hypothetical protein [Butyrivibrio sp. AE3009]